MSWREGIDRARRGDKVTHRPGWATRRGGSGWYLDWIDPWGHARVLSAPLEDESAAEAMAREQGLPRSGRRPRL